MLARQARAHMSCPRFLALADCLRRNRGVPLQSCQLLMQVPRQGTVDHPAVGVLPCCQTELCCCLQGIGDHPAAVALPALSLPYPMLAVLRRARLIILRRQPLYAVGILTGQGRERSIVLPGWSYATRTAGNGRSSCASDAEPLASALHLCMLVRSRLPR